jgi:hypothetical protein
MPILQFDFSRDYRLDAEIVVPLTIRNGVHSVSFLAKVDTGAAYCIFKREYAEALGLDPDGGEPLRLEFADGSPFNVNGHHITIEVAGASYDSLVYFGLTRRNVLGRIGWLNRFRAGIVESQTHLYLAFEG